MATLSYRQWVAISASILLLVSLFFINQKPPLTQDMQKPSSGGHATNLADFGRLVDEAKNQVPADKQKTIGRLDNSLSGKSPDEQAIVLRSIINLYDSAGAQIPATVYMEKLAGIKNSADLWYLSGDRYYNASQLTEDPQVRGTLLQKASDCFNSSFKIDSTNLDTRVGMAQCIVEGGGAPMQGIQILEGVLKKDSNNKKAQIALGEFSIQSGQYPKAIYRFNRVLQIDPKYSEAYLYLEDTYEKMGNKQEAIRCLEKYSTFVADKKLKDQVNGYILKLKNDTINK